MAKARGSSGGLPSKREILDYLETHGGDAARRDIARAFGVKGEARTDLRRLLREMTEEGLIKKSGRKRSSKTGQLPPVGVIDLVGQDTDGELLGAPVNWREETPPPKIILAPGDNRKREPTPALGVGDRVLARLAKTDDGVYEARLIKRLGQSAHRVLGVYRETGAGGRVEPVDRKAKRDILIAQGDSGEAKNGDLVLAELRSDGPPGLKRGRLVEIVGHIDDPKAIGLIALHAHGVPTGFTDAELEEAKRAAPADHRDREDLRNIPLITIDPADARDHDDAVWAAPDTDPQNENGWRVIVAIADVARYVRPGSALDKGAQTRGNSVYLPGQVIPMLPERLSNDLCSLREKEDRPCLAVEMRFSASGRKKGHRFLRGVMKSAAKLSYEEAQAAIDGSPNEKTEPLLEPVLRPLFAAYRALAEARDKRGPLHLDLPERRIVLDDEGRVAGIRIPARLDAHRLVEEFMIQANVAAAETLEAARTPFIYRAHDAPDPDKIEALREYLASIGYKLSRSEAVKPIHFNKILAEAKARGEIETVSEVVLRSQSQAVYTPEDRGHFGLNLRRYAHFTSPIRRYADLVVHRALIKTCDLGSDGLTNDEIAHLEDLSQAISNYERRAMAAERDTVDRYLAGHLDSQIGAEFEGRVSGVTRFGLFVRLDETGADGLVPIRALGFEYFHHDEARHALVGEESGREYRLSQKVRVRLEETSPIKGGLRFDILTPPEAGDGLKKKTGRRKTGIGGRRRPRRGR